MGNAGTGVIRRRRDTDLCEENGVTRVRRQENAARIEEVLPAVLENLARGIYPPPETAETIVWQGRERVAWRLVSDIGEGDAATAGIYLMNDGTFLRSRFGQFPYVETSIEEVAIPKVVSSLELIASFGGTPPARSWRVL